MGPLLIIEAGGLPKRVGLAESFPEMFVRLGGIDPAKCRVARAHRSRLPKSPAGFSGAIVTGSLSMVTDKPLWSLRLSGFLLRLMDLGTPLLGVCYGHQLLAEALGGRSGDHPGGKEQGTFEIRLKEVA